MIPEDVTVAQVDDRENKKSGYISGVAFRGATGSPASETGNTEIRQVP
jgi:hypothetical protein